MTNPDEILQSQEDGNESQLLETQKQLEQKEDAGNIGSGEAKRQQGEIEKTLDEQTQATGNS